MTRPAPRIPILAAPTASGKSSAALNLAKNLPLEIITADAMQVYRGMNIGTAKPTAAEQASVPHHLIDLVNPDESFSVAQYVNHAENAIQRVLDKGKLPFVVGGTGFYIRALKQGLPTVPAADLQVQAELWQTYETHGIKPLQDELELFSPVDAVRAQRNPRRVVRALEIIRRTGKAPSAFAFTTPAFTYEQVSLLPDMAVLSPRIHARAARMIQDGLVEEVKALLIRFPQQPTAMQAIGYKEIVAFLTHQCTLEDAQNAVALATVQYAKRQRTWFKKDDGEHYLNLAAEVQDTLFTWLQKLVHEASAV